MDPIQVAISQMRGVVADFAHAVRSGRYPWWYPEEARSANLQIGYFVYGVRFVPLAASATTPQTFNVNGDSAFVVLSGVLVETDTANTTFLANRPLLANIQDAGSGEYLSNIPIHANNWFGTAEEPKYWDVPRIIPPASVVSVELQNLEATARNIHVAFHGFKIFGFPARARSR